MLIGPGNAAPPWPISAVRPSLGGSTGPWHEATSGLMPWGCGWLLMVVPRDVRGRVRNGGDGRAVMTGAFSLVPPPCARPSPTSRVRPRSPPLTWGIRVRSFPGFLCALAALLHRGRVGPPRRETTGDYLRI